MTPGPELTELKWHDNMKKRSCICRQGWWGAAKSRACRVFAIIDGCGHGVVICRGTCLSAQVKLHCMPTYPKGLFVTAGGVMVPRDIGLTNGLRQGVIASTGMRQSPCIGTRASL
ncbi:hypothetical protein BGZ61DRAFT_448939 [Ilyonectria robusta]|uniref:uncharacterized protein n=1 Tax=Ilyonectria robusta TaxID=1079257 RepID=UPI001E8E9E6E|nr:uncharacterized protein BGZ61DRAFT_448939 [Ilyonectria robusta]KAH8714369.1 hypothetical protein BGZ61DRAFT_448939 [Ilyonectria robusta]